jgi:hypothetical protein
MAPHVTHAPKSSPSGDQTDWLALFPAEQGPRRSEFERPSDDDPLELFPRERRLIEPPQFLPTRQLPPAPRPAAPVAARIRIEPGWEWPRLHLTPLAWATLVAIAAMPMIVFLRATRMPALPDVLPASVTAPAADIALPAFALDSTPRDVAPPPAATVPAPDSTTPVAPLQAAIVKPGVVAPSRSTAPPVRQADPPRVPSGAAAQTTSNSAAASTPPSPPPVATPPATEPVRVSDPPPVVTAPPAVVTLPAAALPEETGERAVDPATPRAADTAAIESVLGRYRSGYEALDIGAVQKTFPKVDRQALERSFGELAEQSLQFDDCQIDIAGRDARVACTGSARSVTKSNARQRFESRRWDFTLSKIGSAWLILSAQSKR